LRACSPVASNIDFETGEISRRVEHVSVSGFTIRGFSGDGVAAAAAPHVTIAGNVTEDNGDAGIAAIGSNDVRVLSNRTAGNRFGVFAGGSLGGSIAGNTITGNCAGVFAIGQRSATGGFRLAANSIRRNTRACPAAGDWPSLSGVGVTPVGASDDTVMANVVRENVPSGESAVGGGVVVLGRAWRHAVRAQRRQRDRRQRSRDPLGRRGTGNVFRQNVVGP
jgi:parallel beta-helix repeat protein